ncbi:MAG TPA: hypothetical protein V6C85_36875 [Allocoleopsis sp.]
MENICLSEREFFLKTAIAFTRNSNARLGKSQRLRYKALLEK